MIYWKCVNCDTNNMYPDNVECECCGERITPSQTEEAKRFMFYKRRADEGDTYAMMDMANFYKNGNIFTKEIDLALEMMTKAAELGNADAQQDLAEWYYCEDNDFPNDDNLAMEWATKAYKNNNPYSVYFLYNCYLNGTGTPMNEKYAIELLKESADMGFARAIEDIGNFYFAGLHIEKDENKAIKYFQQLSVDDNCSNETAYNIGVIYWKGKGTSVNYQKAVEWFEYAVDTYDDWGSKIPLAIFHYDGTGYPKDELKGKSMMRQIADNKSDNWASDMAKKYLTIWESN